MKALPGLLAAALFASGSGCAQLDSAVSADGGLLGGPRVSDVQPPEGEAGPKTIFQVTFSAAMDEGVLLASTGRSESVALVSEALVERAAAAIEHSRLTVEERSLLVSASASIDVGAEVLTLVPDASLAPGTYYLLAAAKLRDTAGNHLSAPSRTRYSVAAPRAQLTLIAPPPGAIAPLNLARVRVTVGSGAGTLSLVGPAGPVPSVEIGAPGPLELPLCPAASASSCSVLQPGQSYSLALDGKRIDGTSFSAGGCARLLPPRGTAALSVRDTSVTADVQLDWPARVALRAGCTDADGGCLEAFAETSCGPDPCAPSPPGACAASVRLTGLDPATDYTVHVDFEDDERRATVGMPQQVTTLSLLPTVAISEVMASPPGPAPRSDGEYVELWNSGKAPVDVSGLTLTGPDGTARGVLATVPADPVVLPAGARGLAVGASFDASRYSLPPKTLLLRAATQRLLGRGLSDTSPPSLVVSSDGGVELAMFPGGGPACPLGASLEPDGASGWKCGKVGGSPGSAP
jgi:hypothetical protein